MQCVNIPTVIIEGFRRSMKYDHLTVGICGNLIEKHIYIPTTMSGANFFNQCTLLTRFNGRSRGLGRRRDCYAIVKGKDYQKEKNRTHPVVLS